jgi:hypothetical protein
LLRSSSTHGQKSSLAKITTSTLKVAYALLQEPKILSDTQVVAEVAGIDSKTVKRSLDSLYQLNYLQRLRGGKYQIQDYINLLERWEMSYVEELRSELLIDTFSPIKNLLFTDVSNEILEIAQLDKILVGGELGAAILTDYLQPVSTVLHIPEQENYRMITTKLRLKQDKKGSITILKQFGTQNNFKDDESKPIADPLLIHAELALSPDERLKETAKGLYDKHIAKRKQLFEMK